MSNDKYTLFKNYMHNELGITKDDIKRWTKEAVVTVAENHVEHQLNTEYLMDGILKHALGHGMYRGFSSDIKRAVAEEITKNIDIKFIK